MAKRHTFLPLIMECPIKVGVVTLIQWKLTFNLTLTRLNILYLYELITKLWQAHMELVQHMKLKHQSWHGVRA